MSISPDDAVTFYRGDAIELYAAAINASFGISVPRLSLLQLRARISPSHLYGFYNKSLDTANPMRHLAMLMLSTGIIPRDLVEIEIICGRGDIAELKREYKQLLKYAGTLELEWAVPE
jgi:hypothetical protein